MNGKTFQPSFFPVGDGIEAIVTDWISFLFTERLYGPDDPLFPATRIAVGESGLFEASGLERKHWGNANAVRRIFRRAFKAAGLPYFNPHSFRNTLAALGEKVCATPEMFKAWSQNLAHESVLTTFSSYGTVARERQAEILAELRGVKAGKLSPNDQPDKETIQRVLAHLAGREGR